MFTGALHDARYRRLAHKRITRHAVDDLTRHPRLLNDPRCDFGINVVKLPKLLVNVVETDDFTGRWKINHNGMPRRAQIQRRRSSNYFPGAPGQIVNGAWS